MRRRHFDTSLFEPTFTARTDSGEREYRKAVVLLSIVPDIRADLHEHLETGILFDPEAIRSSRIARAADRPRRAHEYASSDFTWIRQSIRRVGPLSVERFFVSFSRLVRKVREVTGAHVVVFNTLTLACAGDTHNHQFIEGSGRVRREGFNLALAELSRNVGFPVLDVDRILKRSGASTQFGWDEIDPRLHRRVGEELVRLMENHGLFASAPS